MTGYTAAAGIAEVTLEGSLPGLPMNWLQRFRLKEYLRSSLWPVPVAGIFVGLLLFIVANRIESQLEDTSSFYFDASTTTTIMASIITATISFVGFVLTMLVLVIQFTGTSLSLRVLHVWYRDRFLKLSLGMFTVGLSYAFSTLSEVGDGRRHGPTVYLAFVLQLFALIFFLAFLSHLLTNIRPATLASHIATIGMSEIEATFPRPFPGTDPGYRYRLPEGELRQTILNDGPGRTIQAVNHAALVDLARSADGTIVLFASIGEQVRHDGRIALMFNTNRQIPESAVIGQIALGAERTNQQDPAFLMRILVDIAIKALSPAINDPTTAKSCIDYIEDLLTILVSRDLNVSEWRDVDGEVRLIVPSHTWDDFLWLAVTEIRQFGAPSIQVLRRLRLMLARLLNCAPEARLASIVNQITLLEETTDAAFTLVAGDLMQATNIDLLRDSPGEGVN